MNVVRRRVFERQAFLESVGRQPKLEERGILKHRERPLVGYETNGHALVAKRCDPHTGGISLAETLELVLVGEARVDDFPVAQEAARHERVPVHESLSAQCAQDASIRRKNSSVPVAE